MSDGKYHRMVVIACGLLGCALAWTGVSHGNEGGVSPPPDELAMIVASSTGNLPALERLFSKGLEVNHHDFSGNTPLIYAARYARVDMVHYLLQHGADVNAVTHWGTTALKEAVRKGSQPVVQALLDAGADVNLMDRYHETALFDAVKYRRLWAVEMLLASHAQVDVENDQGYTPLLYALEQGQDPITEELKQHQHDARVGISLIQPAEHGVSGNNTYY